MSNVLVATPRSTSKFTPEQIACFYFKPFITEDGDPTGLQICKASGKTRKHVPKSGFTNLVSHVRSDHGNIEVEMEAASNAATGTLLPWMRQKASNRHAWLEWVVKGTSLSPSWRWSRQGGKILLSFCGVLTLSNQKYISKKYLFGFPLRADLHSRRVGDRQDTRVVSAIISRERNIALAYRYLQNLAHA
ncbi:hypothetical protein PC129_g20748 [Phytophthora cactorum]|uniref:Uncharacterized protein n=1 Tax=Phytophthora cactorum TaxID=29920 RepID=A0A8T1B666_9STRA|nr:hypothetical protein Pcac1_g28816 [Phytophthora cactorum]KAG2797988.1 hypothetical protein PC111_g21045 [Phytophthora cactorum]KAG2877251.1 hypothetical protein PC114_g23749 [Phytophthora cactorum]KAG2894848.1 hypothetical protein PC117_g23381 [Phytophthora cactorum]KAG3208220.1 hypothetical protein PC129_g20748 [Phytophthora cactorum]